jgi:hypothetical protein
MTIEWPRGIKSSLLQTFGPTGIVNEKVYENDTLGKCFDLIFPLNIIENE